MAVFPVNASGPKHPVDINGLLALHSSSFVSIRDYMKAQFPDEETESGEFKRQADAFRECISNDGSTPYAAELGAIIFTFRWPARGPVGR